MDPLFRPGHDAMLRGKLAWRLLRLAGWTVVLAQPVPDKAVGVFYPHTSNWDFVLGMLTKWATGLEPAFFAKETLFRRGFGRWLRRLGGIPVDRSRHAGLVAQLADEFSRRERFLLVITPEGTRGLTAGWKSGFYRIARAARVPLALAFVDYRTRRVGIGGYLPLTGDGPADWQALAGFYREKVGRHPQLQSPVVPLEPSTGT